MFCSRSTNNKINKLHGRSLRIILYDDSNSKFEDFLTKDSSFTIYHQNIQTMEINMFKFTRDFHKSLFWICLIIINITNLWMRPEPARASQG